MKIKGAIFDMDGTVVDSLMFWDYLWSSIGERYMNDASFRPTEEINKRVRTMIYVDAMTYFKEYYKIPGDTNEFISFAESGLSEFYKSTATVKAGAVKLLESLRAQNVRICLASATALDAVKYALECHDLLKYFDFVISCADIGVGKDKPDIYIKAMKLLELQAEDICVFEDSYVALETAKGVGFKTVGVFDRYNFGQDRLRASSDYYLGEGVPLDTALSVINN